MNALMNALMDALMDTYREVGKNVDFEKYLPLFDQSQAGILVGDIMTK